MISVVIPAYNEQDAIVETVEKIRQTLTGCEIIVVDDGSSDDTANRAKQAGAIVAIHPHNIGYGKSLKTGIEKATYDTIVISDADGTYPIDKIPDLLAEYERGFDMVIGKREGKHLDFNILKKILRWVLKLIVEYTAGRNIPDINSGLRVFSKKTALPYFPHLSNSFSFTTSITLAYILDLKFVTYISIPYHKRKGKTKVRLTRDILRTMQYITNVILVYNPIKLYLFVAFFLGLCGIICFILPFYIYAPFLFPLAFSFLTLSVVCFLLSFVSNQLLHIRQSIDGKNRT